MNTRTCQHCGQPADNQVMLCPFCGNALPPPMPEPTHDQTVVSPPTLQGDAGLAPPTLVQPTYVHPTYVQPTQQMAHTPVVIAVPQPPSGPKRGSGVVLGMILGFVVIAALVVIGVKVVEKRADDTPGQSAETVPASAPSVDSTSGAVSSATVAPVITPAITLPIVAATVAPVTAEPTIAPTVAPLPTAPPIAGPGVPQVTRDPMSDGVPYSDVSASFLVAQELADALAADDWNRARQLEPAKANFTDAQYAGYQGLDRASLILMDARPDGDGYRNLVVSVANENDGTQTTLFCLEWSASAATETVVQHTGVVGKLTTLDGMVSSEAVLSDPTLVDLVMSKCVWS